MRYTNTGSLVLYRQRSTDERIFFFNVIFSRSRMLQNCSTPATHNSKYELLHGQHATVIVLVIKVKLINKERFELASGM